MASDAEVQKFVAANPNAIGHIDKSAVDGSVKVIPTPYSVRKIVTSGGTPE